MTQYIIRRLLAIPPVLVGVSMFVFVAIRVVPGDTATVILGENANPQDLETLRHQLGMDRPLPVQYWDWVRHLAVGDFGKSVRTGLPILSEIEQRLPVTLELAALAMIFSVGIGILAGVMSAVYQNRWQDYALRLFSVGGLSMPEFWVGTLLLLLPLLWFGWTPRLHYVSFFKDPRLNIEQFFLPAIAMGISLSAIVTRMVRSSMLEVLRQDYVRTARAKGLPATAVIIRHGLRNALMPVITILGLQVGRLLGGAIVMEQIFALPGLGRFVLEAISARDFLMLQTVVLVTALFLQVANLLVDLSYAWLDPRVRYA